jgi:hypothetical protein
MCAAGAAMNLAHGRVPWPADFFVTQEFLEVMLRTFVTAVLGACLIVVLHEPAPDQKRVRTDESKKR